MQACLSILRILSATFNRTYVENGALMYVGGESLFLFVMICKIRNESRTQIYCVLLQSYFKEFKLVDTRVSSS